MLLIPLYGTGAQIVRVMYYIGSALGVLLLFSLVKSSVSDILAGRSSIYVAVAVDIVFLIILAVPQFSFGTWLGHSSRERSGLGQQLMGRNNQIITLQSARALDISILHREERIFRPTCPRIRRSGRRRRHIRHPLLHLVIRPFEHEREHPRLHS
jgi:hypothetical protein